MDIKKQFDDVARKYDTQRRQFIPCFDDFYSIPFTVLNCKTESPAVLDIGAGTGLCSTMCLKYYPNAKITLIDLSDDMLNIAKKRFMDTPNIKYITADYTKYNFETKFDIIISALSIHHLSGNDKATLYKKCFEALTDCGEFLNIDQVLSPSKEMECKFSELWRNTVEAGGLSKDEILRGYERVKLDNPSTLAEQLEWLKNAGFRYADAVYKYYHFCAIYAKK